MFVWPSPEIHGQMGDFYILRVYSVTYDSGSVPEQSILFPCETPPTLSLSTWIPGYKFARPTMKLASFRVGPDLEGPASRSFRGCKKYALVVIVLVERGRAEHNQG